MIKKIILLAAILLPFILYYLSVYLIKKDTSKKFPMIPLSLASLILLALVLIFLDSLTMILQMANIPLLNLRMEKLYLQKHVRP